MYLLWFSRSESIRSWEYCAVSVYMCFSRSFGKKATLVGNNVRSWSSCKVGNVTLSLSRRISSNLCELCSTKFFGIIRLIEAYVVLLFYWDAYVIFIFIVSCSLKPQGPFPYSLSIALVLLSCGLVFSLITFVKGGPSSVLAAVAKSGFTAAFSLIFVSEIGDKVYIYLCIYYFEACRL